MANALSMDAPRPIDHKNQNQRAPAPSGQYPRTHLRPEPTLTVDPPRDPDYRAFLADVAAQLAKPRPMFLDFVGLVFAGLVALPLLRWWWQWIEAS